VVRSARADLYQLGGGKCRKLFPARFLISEIASNQATVGLANLHEQFARLMVRHTRDIQTLVRLTLPKYGNVYHCRVPIATFLPQINADTRGSEQTI
jgi:hypothetical protein